MRTSQRWKDVLVLIGFVIAVTVYAYEVRRHHNADINRLRRDANADVARYEKASDAIAKLLRDLKGSVAQFERHRSDAMRAGQVRHDKAVANTLDSAEALELAKSEQSAVSEMQDDAESVDDGELAVLDEFDKLYGPPSTASARSYCEDLLSQRRQWLSSWGRAVGDTVDYEQELVNGQSPETNESSIETFYHEAEQGEVRSEATRDSIGDSFEKLESRLQNDIQGAKRRLAAANTTS